MSRLVRSRYSKIFLALLLALSVGLLAGCEDQGPAEEAGENVDEAVEEAGDMMEEAGENVEDTVEDAGDEMEEAAEEAEDEVDDATGGG